MLPELANRTYRNASSNRTATASSVSLPSSLCCIAPHLMASSFGRRIAFLTLLIYLLPGFSAAQNNCNTQANPYCAGDSRFANVCCPFPSVCYYKDRLGTPSCCGAGQTCLIAQTTPPPVFSNSAVSPASGLAQVTASMTKFRTHNLSLTSPAAAFSIIRGLLVGAALPIARTTGAAPILLPFVLMAWHMT